MDLKMKSPVLDEFGTQAEASSSWEPPKNGSAYFGWIDINGFNTVHVEAVKAVVPIAQRSDLYLLVLASGQQMNIPTADAMRLMQRMGWSEPRAKARVV